MFFPVCRSEYRESFTHCADCNVGLVDSLLEPQHSESPNRSISAREFLPSFIPMAAFYLTVLLLMSKPHVADVFAMQVYMVMLVLVCDFGGFWMMYQAIRYEEHQWRYFFLALIPFMFVWYLRERYRKRSPREQIPFALR